MLRRRTPIVVIMIAGLLVVGSTGLILAHERQGATSAQGTAQPTSLVTQHAWKLDAFTFDGQKQALLSDVSITLTFHTQQHWVGGNSGCNSYGATYTIAEAHQQLRLSDAYQAAMACVRPGVMEEEYHYLTALAHVTRYHVGGVGLTLQDDTGRYVLRYIAMG